MTAQSDFGGDEWTLIQEGPLTAGMIVLTAEGGGTIRETFALARAYADTRKQHGESELLDEIASDSPKFDRHRYASKEEPEKRGCSASATPSRCSGRRRRRRSSATTGSSSSQSRRRSRQHTRRTARR